MKKRFYCRRDRVQATKAFTLVEVLVAEAVFLILLVIVVQLIFSIISIAGAQKKRMDSLGDARQSLDRLSLDWASRVRRSDSTGTFTPQSGGNYLAQGSVTGIFTKQAGNDQVGFLSQIQTYTGARRVGWVSYQVNPISQVTQGSQVTSTSALERGMFAYNWSPTDSGTNPLLSLPLTAAPVLTASNYEPLGNTIFRLEICFLQKVPAVPTSPPLFTVDSGTTLTSTNFSGVVVAVAALDQQSRQILSQTQLAALATALPRVTTDGQDPQSLWIANMNSGTFAAAAASAGIPKSIISAVRIYQRILYIKE
jgi:type II secretory pathway pseudopilin PulG